MSKKPYRDAELILKLYDLRREKTMREARSWFILFSPESAADIMDTLASDKSAYYRMVTSYWEMAASLVNHGAIDADMFNDANGEHIVVYAKLEPFLAELRQEMGPKLFEHLERVVKAIPEYEARLTAIRERMKKIIALYQQRMAAQTAAASGD